MVQINETTHVYDKLARNCATIRLFAYDYKGVVANLLEKEDRMIYKGRLRNFKSSMSKVHNILSGWGERYYYGHLDSTEPVGDTKLNMIVRVAMFRLWDVDFGAVEDKDTWKYRKQSVEPRTAYSGMYPNRTVTQVETVSDDMLDAAMGWDQFVSIVGEEERARAFLMFKLAHL